MAPLEFQAPDFARFPCLRLAFAALAQGGTAPTILNAANEVAVRAFLEQQIRFTDIAIVVEHALEQISHRAADTLAAILDDDARARIAAEEWVASHDRGTR